MIQRAEHIAFDYRCEYANADDIIAKGFKRAVLSFRGFERITAPVLNKLRAAGVTVGVNLEPWARAGIGYGYDYDYAVNKILRDTHGYLHLPDGSIAHPGAEWGWTADGYDFRNDEFRLALADYNTGLPADFFYLDYGFPFGGLGWVNGYEKVAANVWPQWAEGYQWYMAQFQGKERIIGTGRKWNPAAATYGEAFVLEGVEIDNRPSRPLFTYQEAYNVAIEAAKIGKRAMIFCLNSNEQHRRTLGTMCAMTGGYFSHRWRDKGEIWNNRRAPEIDIPLGTITSLPTAPAPSQYLTQGTMGWAMLNLSTTPMQRKLDGVHYTVPAKDALVVQTKDESGKGIKPHVTNTGEGA